MLSLIVGIGLILSKPIFSARVPVAPICDELDAWHTACCPEENEFPQRCIPYDPTNELCKYRENWFCCFNVVGGHQLPGGFDHIGYRCRRARKLRWADVNDAVNEACPVPLPPITNPFQPLDNFFNLKDEGKPPPDKSDCQSLDSSLLDSSEEIFSSSDISDLFPPIEDYNDGGTPGGGVDWDLGYESPSLDQADQQTDTAAVDDNSNVDIDYNNQLLEQDEIAVIPDFAHEIQSPDQSLFNDNLVVASNQSPPVDNIFQT